MTNQQVSAWHVARQLRKRLALVVWFYVDGQYWAKMSGDLSPLTDDEPDFIGPHHDSEYWEEL